MRRRKLPFCRAGSSRKARSSLFCTLCLPDRGTLAAVTHPAPKIQLLDYCFALPQVTLGASPPQCTRADFAILPPNEPRQALAQPPSQRQRQEEAPNPRGGISGFVPSSQQQPRQTQQLPQLQQHPHPHPRPPQPPRARGPEPDPPGAARSKRPRIPGPAAAFLPGGGGAAELNAAFSGSQLSAAPFPVSAAQSASQSAALTQRSFAALSDLQPDFSAPCWRDALRAIGAAGAVFAPAGPPLEPSLGDIVSGAHRGRVPRVVALVTAVRRTPAGDALCTLADPSGSLTALAHAAALRQCGGAAGGTGATQPSSASASAASAPQPLFFPPLTAGCALVAVKVPVLIPALDRRERLLVIVEGCLVHVFPPAPAAAATAVEGGAGGTVGQGGAPAAGGAGRDGEEDFWEAAAAAVGGGGGAIVGCY